MEKIKVAMLVDFMASSFGSIDDEYDEIEMYITEIFPEMKITFQRELHTHLLRKMKYDIFVFDWGGLLPGADDLTRSVYKSLLYEVREYEKDRLYIMWSSFTEMYYKNMANEEFPEFITPNVVFRQDKAYQERCRLFFGLSKTPSITKLKDSNNAVGKLIAPPSRPKIGSSVFCRIDDALVYIIKDEADSREIIDCGAGEGMLGNKLLNVISIDIMPQSNPKVIEMDCTQYPFNDETMPIFIRPCHSVFVEETLLKAMNRDVKSALYIGLIKNVDDDLGVFSKLAIPIHEEWVGADGEQIWRIPFSKEENNKR